MATDSPNSPPSWGRRFRRGVVRLGVIVAVMGAILLAIGLIFSPDRAMIFPTSIAGPLPQPPNGVEVLQTDEGVVWLLPAQTTEPAPAIMLFHGNGENIANLLSNAKVYQSRGLTVVLVEYPGYGGTAGKPTQDSVTNAAVAAYDAIKSREGVIPERILAHGFSLGGGVAAQLAERRPLAGLILESTFSSLPDMYRSMRIPGFLCRDPFRTDMVLAGFDRPVLLIHGRNDTIVPSSHSQRLHAIAPDSVYLELEHGHNDGPSDPRAYWQAIDDLVASTAP
jgi:pimeloyl-ACP methyl ester carboxylesterase